MCFGRQLCPFFFQAEDGIRDLTVTGVQTCALPICSASRENAAPRSGIAFETPSLLHSSCSPLFCSGGRSLPWKGPAIRRCGQRRCRALLCPSLRLQFSHHAVPPGRFLPVSEPEVERGITSPSRPLARQRLN